jgi:hypothetical protein
MTQQQTAHKTGSPYHLNLDSNSVASLRAAFWLHEQHGNVFSNSVITRRALRHYSRSLEGMTELEMNQEVVEIKRAAKGLQ